MKMPEGINVVRSQTNEYTQYPHRLSLFLLYISIHLCTYKFLSKRCTPRRVHTAWDIMLQTSDTLCPEINGLRCEHPAGIYQRCELRNDIRNDKWEKLHRKIFQHILSYNVNDFSSVQRDSFQQINQFLSFNADHSRFLIISLMNRRL